MNNNNFIYNGCLSGSSVILGMLSGHLLMENIKMEKQRTSLKYNVIAKNFIRKGVHGYLSGFFPWGIMLGFGKGFIVGSVSTEIGNHLNKYDIQDKNKPLIKGIGTGIVESLYMNPIMMARAKINKRIINSPNNKNTIKDSIYILNKNIKKKGISTIYSGIQLLALRRCIDWGSRFTFIHYFQNNIIKYYNYENNNDLSLFQRFYSTALGSALTTPFSTPIDRLLPIIYTSSNYKEVIKKIKYNTKQYGIARTFFSGLVMRTISTGYYTTFLLFIPYIINKKI